MLIPEVCGRGRVWSSLNLHVIAGQSQNSLFSVHMGAYKEKTPTHPYIHMHTHKHKVGLGHLIFYSDEQAIKK